MQQVCSFHIGIIFGLLSTISCKMNITKAIFLRNGTPNYYYYIFRYGALPQRQNEHAMLCGWLAGINMSTGFVRVYTINIVRRLACLQNIDMHMNRGYQLPTERPLNCYQFPCEPKALPKRFHMAILMNLRTELYLWSGRQMDIGMGIHL